MHAWEQIQLTIDYIEDHLCEKLSIEDLARMAALSPFYYQRLFSRLVKKPVAEYIRLRRMAKALELLLKDDRRILEIALDLGFASHEHFTRTFKEAFGMTPDEYRKHPMALNRMTKPELLLHYVLVDEGVPLITDGIVLEINRHKVRDPIPFSGLELELPVTVLQGLGTESGIDPMDELWRHFHERKEAEFAMPQSASELGVAYACDRPGYFAYFAGGEGEPADMPEDGKRWILPEGEYVVCAFEAENFDALVMDALYKAQHYLYNTFLANHKLQTEGFCAERYAAHSPDTTSMELWLKLIPQA